MYSPIPGYAHLMVLTPPDPIKYARQETSADIAMQSRLLGPVTLALETAAGLRPLSALRDDVFAKAIHIHLRAWQRSHPQGGGMQLMSVHARPGGEFHGSARMGATRYAFTGFFSNDQMKSFRLL